MRDIKLELVELFRNKFDTGNCEKPEFTDEKFDEAVEVSLDGPLVTLPQSSETTETATGFSGMTSSGDPLQEFDGEATVKIWTTEEALRSIAATTRNVHDWIFDCRQELQRIVQHNHDVIADYDYISWINGHDQNETDREPTLYCRVSGVGYRYRKM